jgi:hypothetical protein
MSVENGAPAMGNEQTSAPVSDPNSIGEGGEKAVGVTEEPKSVVQSLADRWKKQRNDRGQFKKEADAAKEAAKEGSGVSPQPALKAEEPAKEEPKIEEKKEEEKGLALRHARALADLKKAQKDTLDHKAKLEETSKALESFKVDFEKNPLRALEKATGKTFMEIMKAAATGKFDQHPIPDELRSEIDELKKFREEQQKAREEQTTAAQRDADNKYVKTFLDSRADDYPIFASLDWGVEELREAAYAHLKEHGEQPNLGELAKGLEERALQTLSATLTQERLVRAVAKKPEVRAVLLKALGALQPAAIAPAGGPKAPAQPVLTNAATQEAPVTSQKQVKAKTALDLDDDQIERWKRFKATGKLD